jgi:hypothetical protein
MTQKVVHKMGVVNDMYYFFTKNFFLSNCHIMKKKMLISIKNYFYFISVVFRWFSVRNLNQMSLISDSKPFIISHPPLWFSNPSLYLTTDLSV